MNKLRHRLPVIIGVCVVIICLSFYLHWNNTALEVTHYTVSSGRVPESFDGYKIVQISDLHNTEFGKDNSRLLYEIRQLHPDMIVLTGDLIDSRRTNIDIAVEFAGQAAQIAPVYYAPGNHEARLSDPHILYAMLTDAGVNVLLDQSVTVWQDSDKLQLVGAVDRAPKKESELADVLPSLLPEEDFTILLSHRPEYFDTYVLCGADLIFTGHVHGGQFRLPFIGGLFTPSQGFFPKYDDGVFTSGKTNMVISRGLGNSLFPFRLNNRPEIVVVTLQKVK